MIDPSHHPPQILWAVSSQWIAFSIPTPGDRCSVPCPSSPVFSGTLCRWDLTRWSHGIAYISGWFLFIAGTDGPQFAFPLSCLQFAAITNKMGVCIQDTGFLCKCKFSFFLDKNPALGWVTRWVMFNFMRNFQPTLQSDCHLRSHQQWMRAPGRPHPRQHRALRCFLSWPS